MHGRVGRTDDGELTAVPHEHSQLAGWSGNCSGTASSVSVTVDASKSCTATFIRTYTLTVTKTGDGAVESLVTSDPAGISCGGTCSATYDSGTSVTLTAEAAEGYEFEGWSGTGCNGGGSTVTVTMDQARSFMAVFAAVPPPGCGPGDESACVHDGGSWEPESCTCNCWWMDPLVIPLDGHPVRLTGVAGGVLADVNGDGVPDRLAWTVAGAPVGFLALDRDGDGRIDHLGDLFGRAASGQRRPEGTANSFLDLAAFDRPENGGNGDGVISAADAVFRRLRVWVDANHDGVSQPGELLTLAQAGIASIELSYQPVRRRDRFGNYFRYRAIVHLRSGGQTTAWDVFLAARLNSGGASAAALPGPIATGFAGLGAGLIAVGLAVLIRPRRQRQRASAERHLPAAVVRASVTGLTTLAVVLLWPSATFGQGSQTWQVVEYYDVDAVGSVRAVTNAQGQLVVRHDFLPFGEELNPQIPPHDKRLFTGQERDFETGFDHFLARYGASNTGRFTAPDPIGGDLLDPQTQNKYAYARNNPLRFVDPTGLYLLALGCEEDRECRAEARRFELQRQADLNSKNLAVVAAALAYGDLGEANGVIVTFGNQKMIEDNCGRGTSGCAMPQFHIVDGKHADPDILVMIKTGQSDEMLNWTAVHEGSHVFDALEFFGTYDSDLMSFDSAKNYTHYQTELKAYAVANSLRNRSYTIGKCSTSPRCSYELNPSRNLWDWNNGVAIHNLLNDPINGYDPNGSLYKFVWDPATTAPRK